MDGGDRPPRPPPKHSSSSSAASAKTAAEASAVKSAPVSARADRSSKRERKKEEGVSTAAGARAIVVELTEGVAQEPEGVTTAAEAEVPAVVAEGTKGVAEEEEPEPEQEQEPEGVTVAAEAEVRAVVAEETKGVAEEEEPEGVTTPAEVTKGVAEESEGGIMVAEATKGVAEAQEPDGVTVAAEAPAVVAEVAKGKEVAVPLRKYRLRPPNLDPMEAAILDGALKGKEDPLQSDADFIETYYETYGYGYSSGNHRHLAIETVEKLWSKGHTCVQLQGQGIDTYFYCTVCRIAATFLYTIGFHFTGDTHKAALKAVSYSMLPNAIPWPFNDGHRFHNSKCFNGPNDIDEIDDRFKYCGDIFTVQTLGVGKIGSRRKPKDAGFHVIKNWCEWLGTVVGDNIWCTNGLLTFQYPSTVCPAARKCSICGYEFWDPSHVASIVNREKEALACSDSFCKGKGPHIFHVSCLVNWILACEAEGLASFCPDCRLTGWGLDEKPLITRDNFISVRKLCTDGATTWPANCEPLQNNSTGLFFGYPLHILEGEEEVAGGSHVAFYKAIERVTGDGKNQQL